ncbi:unnamed protein product, partial [Larinioides sclopetarius]
MNANLMKFRKKRVSYLNTHSSTYRLTRFK